MKAIEDIFAEAVSAKLRDMKTNAFSFEKTAGLPVDAIRSVIRADEKRAIPRISRAKEICDALDLELYIGPRRDVVPPPETEVSGARFTTVPRHDVQAAAGPGALGLDDPPVDHLAFSKEWLAKNGINAEASVLINARGASMEPAIYDGDLVMVDRRRREVRSGKIYVFHDRDHGVRIKRIELVKEAELLIVRSDNPDQSNYPPEYHKDKAMNQIAASIIGQVVWSGHRWE